MAPTKRNATEHTGTAENGLAVKGSGVQIPSAPQHKEEPGLAADFTDFLECGADNGFPLVIGRGLVTLRMVGSEGIVKEVPT